MRDAFHLLAAAARGVAAVALVACGAPRAEAPPFTWLDGEHPIVGRVVFPPEMPPDGRGNIVLRFEVDLPGNPTPGSGRRSHEVARAPLGPDGAFRLARPRGSDGDLWLELDSPFLGRTPTWLPHVDCIDFVDAATRETFLRSCGPGATLEDWYRFCFEPVELKPRAAAPVTFALAPPPEERAAARALVGRRFEVSATFDERMTGAPRVYGGDLGQELEAFVPSLPATPAPTTVRPHYGGNGANPLAPFVVAPTWSAVVVPGVPQRIEVPLVRGWVRDGRAFEGVEADLAR